MSPCTSVNLVIPCLEDTISDRLARLSISSDLMPAPGDHVRLWIKSDLSDHVIHTTDSEKEDYAKHTKLLVEKKQLVEGSK